MKKTYQSILIFIMILCLCSLAGCSKIGSNIATSTWDGTTIDTSWYSAVDSELYIDTAEQFAGFAELVNSGNTFSGLTVVLRANIDLGGYEWTPIGAYIGSSKGTFDGVFSGNACTVSNFTITNPELEYIGLFGVNNGTILNVTVESFDITLESDVDIIEAGGLAGRNCGQIDMCHARGNIDVYDVYTMCNTGILVGRNNEGMIYNSFSEGKVKASDSSFCCVGGLVGNNFEGGIYNCYSVAEATSYSSGPWGYAGGLIGNNYGAVYDSFALGNVLCETSDTSWMGISHAGGVVGNNGDTGSTANCYRFISQSVIADIIDTSGIAVTEKDLKSHQFYTQKLNWDDSIWNITSEKYPTLKKQ